MNISVIGSKGLAKELAKKGTSSDITLYNTSFQGKYFTFVEPEIYPEKVQTLFQAIAMTQFSILYVTKNLPNNVLGECILALDMLGRKGIIVLDGKEKEEICPLLSGTALKDFPIVENNTAKIFEFLSTAEPAKVEGRPKVLIDHFFLVKNVGTVALGTVVSGEIKKYEKLTLFPVKKEVMIKSIQIHDKEYEKASCYERVGLCLKGVEADEIKRGYIVSDSIECAKQAHVRITKNKFFREEIPKSVMCLVGMQYVRAEIDGNRLIFDSEVAIYLPIVMLMPERKMRIVGTAAFPT